MKKIIIVLIAVITMNLGNRAGAQVSGSISFNTFYNELSPYGQWVNDAQYGQVWIAGAQGFEPYSDNGQWVYTSYGWTWVSDYPWGWAPFHYGRWAHLSHWGWVWVPGYEWGPAWVGWCQNDGYYGWAPLSPGMGINFSFNSIPMNYWRFVRQQYIAVPSVRSHIIRPDRNRNEFRNVKIINNTQVNNNTSYAAGPGKEAVERITRQKIDTRPVAFTGKDVKTSVDRKEVRMYRPDMVKNEAAGNSNRTAGLQKEVPPGTLPKNETATGNAVKPLAGNQPVGSKTKEVQLPVNRGNEKPGNTKQGQGINTLPEKPGKNNTVAKSESPSDRPPLRQESIQQEQMKKQQIQAQQAQHQNELREQQIQSQKEQQQKAMQQQNEQRQNELRQQQIQSQKEQQQRAMQQQNEQRQNELRQQQIQSQKEEQQRAMQQQNEQRQNELRQQQIQSQKEQQQRAMQQQNEQRQNEMRQQRMQEEQMRQQRQPSQSQSSPKKSN